MSTDTPHRAVVVLSGGQDSTTCLYWAIERFGRAGIVSLSFDYGQRHKIELAAAARVASDAGVAHHVLPINTFTDLGGSALTDNSITPETGTRTQARLPNTFVPGRNLIFLTFAAAWASLRGISDLVIGVSQADYSGYPDCRDATLQALATALSLGLDMPVRLHTPLMHLDKAGTVRLAEQLGALPAMAWTHTCYNGYSEPCGHCAACVLRAKGFDEAGIADPLLVRLNLARP